MSAHKQIQWRAPRALIQHQPAPRFSRFLWLLERECERQVAAAEARFDAMREDAMMERSAR
jgi:hypothetical protein